MKRQLLLVIDKNCSSCLRAEQKLKELCNANDTYKLSIIEREKFKGENIFIVPAVFLEDKLIFYGEIDLSKLSKY